MAKTPATEELPTAPAETRSRWRWLLSEYVIVVFGVLTALVAQQIADNVHWSGEAKKARVGLARDHERILVGVGRVDSASPCIARRLSELEAILDRSQAAGRLPPLGGINQPPGYGWFMRSWDGIVGGEILNHLPPQEGGRYSGISGYLTSLREFRDLQGLDWAVLSTMNGPGRPLSEAEAASLRAALGRARSSAAGARTLADLTARMIRDSGLLTDEEVAAAWRSGAGDPNPICAPLSADPAKVSEAMLMAPAAPPSTPYDSDPADRGAGGNGR